MYGNNYRPFITPSNMPYNPYNINPGFSHTILNSGGIRNLFRGIHNINWNGMLNNVSRTLGVVRDAIPVVKEVRPMINNMLLKMKQNHQKQKKPVIPLLTIIKKKIVPKVLLQIIITNQISLSKEIFLFNILNTKSIKNIINNIITNRRIYYCHNNTSN